MTVEGLKPGTTYVFRVRARTDGGYGSYGGEIELETSHEGNGRAYLLGGHENKKTEADPVIDPTFRWTLAGKGWKMVSEALERQRSFVFTLPVEYCKAGLTSYYRDNFPQPGFIPPSIDLRRAQTVFDSA